MTVAAKNLVVDLLSTMPPGRAVPVGALVRAAGIVGVSESSLRVALARLRARGLVDSDERGLYRLGDAAEAVNRHVRSWRSVEEAVTRWDGSWIAVEPGRLERGERSATQRRKRALRLLGFRSLGRVLHVRPNNLLGGVAGVRKRLAALGFGAGALVFRLSDLDATSERRARRLWDTSTLETAYVEMRSKLEASAMRLRGLPRETAMAESFLIGGEAVRQIVLDPLLPAPIVDVRKRRALVDTMRRYDQLGRRCWTDWAGEVVELERSPGDVGGLVREAAAMAGT